jgi:hypothetical protein
MSWDAYAQRMIDAGAAGACILDKGGNVISKKGEEVDKLSADEAKAIARLKEGDTSAINIGREKITFIRSSSDPFLDFRFRKNPYLYFVYVLRNVIFLVVGQDGKNSNYIEASYKDVKHLYDAGQ